MSGSRVARTHPLMIAVGLAAFVAACAVGDDPVSLASRPKHGQQLAPGFYAGIAGFADPGTAAPASRFNVTCRGPHCTFDATGSADPNDFATYRWEWGNGRIEVKPTPTARTLYAAPGNYTVTLTVTVGGFPASAITRQINVPAEPSGSGVIDERRFDCLSSTPTCEPGWAFSQNYVNGFSVVQDLTAPKSPPNVSQQNFLPALPGGSAPATAERSFGGNGAKKTLYSEAWIKLSSDFVGHPSSTNKLVHFFINGANKAFLMARGTGTGLLVPAIGLQGLAAPYDAGSQVATSVNLLPNRGSASIVRGQWHRYETITVANTPNTANGAITVWLDGVKVLEYTNIMFVSTGPAKWDAVQWSPTWGGLGGTIVQPFFAQMDNLYLSGR